MTSLLYKKVNLVSYLTTGFPGDLRSDGAYGRRECQMISCSHDSFIIMFLWSENNDYVLDLPIFTGALGLFVDAIGELGAIEDVD